MDKTVKISLSSDSSQRKKKKKCKADVYTCDFRVHDSNDSTFCQIRIEIYDTVFSLLAI